MQPARTIEPVAARTVSMTDTHASSLPVSKVEHVKLIAKQHADPTSKALDDGVKRNMNTKEINFTGA